MLHNVSLKYGDNYAQKYLDRSQARLRSWGFNTNGNWLDPDILNRPTCLISPALRSKSSIGDRRL